MASQNIYDNDEFYKNYTGHSFAKKKIESVYEWAHVKPLLPGFKEINVLDLGCGHGTFCREAVQWGSKFALGIDLSKNMIQCAEEELAENGSETEKQRIKYEIQDLERLKLESPYDDSYFDLVFSRFTVHYIVNLGEMLKKISKSLRPGGVFVFTAEHPIKLSSLHFTDVMKIKDSDNIERRVWAVSDYSQEGDRPRKWMGVDGVIKQHRQIGTYINLLIESGFIIDHVKELEPSNQQLDQYDLTKANELDKNFMLIIKAIKK